MENRTNHKNPLRAILAVLLAFVLAAFVTIGSVPVAVFAAALDTGAEDSGADNGNEDNPDDDISSDAEDDDSSDTESAADDDEAGDETGETDAELLIDRIGDLEPILGDGDTAGDQGDENGNTEAGDGDVTSGIAENAEIDWQDGFSLEDITDENDGIDDEEDTGENADTDEDIADADSDLDDEDDDDTDSETVTVRMQSGHDFADRDEFGVWRNADGSVASNEFRRYVGVNGDGVLLFTADEDGDITYEEEQKLYFDAEKNAFFSDEDRTLPLTGLHGLLSSAELETDAETALAMLEVSDESAVAVEVSGKDIYPKLLFDRLTGKQLTKEEIAEQGLPADRIEERDPEDQMYLIWKLTESDASYAPEFASYVCASMEGNILFFADDGGCIYQDISEHALYNENYFYTFGGTDGLDGNDGKLITRYGDLGLAHYPAAGEAVRFTVDGEAFELALLDKGEGAKGRYLCRRITDEILGEDEFGDADDDWESDVAEEFGDEADDADDDAEETDDGEYSWNPDKLMDDETVVLVMDANGNICYAADGFEWQFVDYGLDYAQLGRMVAAGRNITDEDDIDDPEDAVLEEEEEPVEDEDGDEPDDEADDPIGSGEDDDEEEDEEEDDSDREVTRDDFLNEEDWEDYLKGEKQLKKAETGEEDDLEDTSAGDSEDDDTDGAEPEEDENEEPEEDDNEAENSTESGTDSLDADNDGE